LGGYMRLIGATFPATVVRGDVVRGSVAWQALAPTPTDYNLFVHATTVAGETVGQYDGPPLSGSYPTHTWRHGEVIVQAIEFEVLPGASAGEVRLHTGWYDWRDGVRLPANGEPGGAVDIGGLLVR
jgi:hypothetical protein